MRPGDRIKIKDAEGRKHRGTVIDGRTTTTLTIDLEPS